MSADSMAYASFSQAIMVFRSTIRTSGRGGVHKTCRRDGYNVVSSRPAQPAFPEAKRKRTVDVRGVIFVVGYAFVPPALAFIVTFLSLAAGMEELPDIALSVLMIWIALALPYAAVPALGLPFVYAFSIAAVQWVLVGLLVGTITRGSSSSRIAVVAFLAFLVVGVAVRVLLPILGYEVIIDGP